MAQGGIWNLREALEQNPLPPRKPKREALRGY